MKETGIFYGSTTGTTAQVAQELGKALGVAAEDIHNVAETSPLKLGEYKLIVIGSSTWGDGDLQEDMYDFLDGVRALDLKGHRIAIFGTGDETMTDTFGNAMAKIRHYFEKTGAEFTGEFNADGYEYHHSDSQLPDGNMVGLLLDQVNHPEYTPQRIKEWAALISKA